MRKFYKVNARLNFSPKYYRAVAEKATEPLLFMYHEAMSIFLGSQNALNLVYFGFFKNFMCLTLPPSRINKSSALGCPQRTLRKWPFQYHKHVLRLVNGLDSVHQVTEVNVGRLRSKPR